MSFLKRSLRLYLARSRNLWAHNPATSKGGMDIRPASTSTITTSTRGGFTTEQYTANKERKDASADALFSYNASRWLWDEPAQLAKRYRRFEVDELAKASAAAVGSTSCVEAEKLVEGNFNKVLLLRMDDGKQVIAKLPNPNAGRPHSITASEVATMDYVRNVLDIPVPEVLDWCSNACKTPVGAEYVLMEKVQGRPLSEHWPSMAGKDRAKIAKQLAEFDSKLALAKFPMYGSLYYADEVLHKPGSAVPQVAVPRSFVVGPSTARTFFDDQRADVDPDCGPWVTAEEYFAAVIERETACVTRFGMSKRQQGICNVQGLYRPTPDAKLSILSRCRTVIGPLLASGTLDCSPSMCHPDLHGDNIFVDPNEPSRITGIIDWQAVHIQPLFLQVRNPALLDVDGPVPEGIQSPQLPENFSTLSDEEQLRAKKLLAAQSLLKVWEIYLCKNAPDAYQALSMRPTLRVQILGLVGSIFDDGDPILEGLLITLQDKWKEATTPVNGQPMPPPCPLSFSAEDRSRQAEDQARWERGVELKRDITDALGVYPGWDGEVAIAEYEQMRHSLNHVREEFLTQIAAQEGQRLEWEKAWPFGNEASVYTS